MNVHRPALPPGPYGLATLPPLAEGRAAGTVVGLVRLEAGVRSPESGLRTSAAHEIGYVVRGRLRIDSAQGSWEAAAGDILVTSPAVDHSTTALEASEIFFVLIEPREPAP